MAEAAVKCPHCQSDAVVKYGKTSTGTERFRCQQSAACGRTFVRPYAYPGCLPTVTQQIVDMTRKGRGSRDIARVLHVGPKTGMRAVKNAAGLSQVNTRVVAGGCPEALTVEGRRGEAAEVDERWSVVGSKAHQRGLWHALEHLRGGVLAYTFGSRADTVCVELQKLLKPCGLEHCYTDGAGVYERHLPAAAHPSGKANSQQIERKPLTLRTRIKR